MGRHEPGLGSPVNPGDPVTERRKTTATTAFGVGRRESHDASDFYARFTPPRSAPTTRSTPCPRILRRSTTATVSRSPRSSRRIPWRSSSPLRLFVGKEYELRHGRSRYPQRCAERSGVLPRVSPDVARRLQGVRRGPRTRRTHRGQCRQSRPQALPLAERRRHLDPARRPRSAVAGRDHLAEGGGRHRFGRLGQLPQGHQPGAA